MLFIDYDQFWNWFDRPFESYVQTQATRRPSSNESENTVGHSFKRPKQGSRRYSILYGRQRAGKKTKVWEADGYLTLVGQVAHVCDLKGRLLEEPTLLDEADFDSVINLEELAVGKTEVQVIEAVD